MTVAHFPSLLTAQKPLLLQWVQMECLQRSLYYVVVWYWNYIKATHCNIYPIIKIKYKHFYIFIVEKDLKSEQTNVL